MRFAGLPTLRTILASYFGNLRAAAEIQKMSWRDLTDIGIETLRFGLMSPSR